MQEHFRTLGAKPDATPEEIKAAWKSQCKAHHPDKGGDPEKFKSVMHAYYMLTDAHYRDEQDKAHPNLTEALKVLIRVPVSFQDVFFGKKVVVSFNRIEIDKDMVPIVKDKYDIVCLTIDLPAGCVDGFQHIEPGKGCQSGELSGDAVLMFQPNPHPRFHVQGLNVIAEERVPLDTMLKGGKIEVLTMYGLKTVAVPPGTQPGEKLAIKRCGVMQRGVHFVVVMPGYPTPDDLKTNPAWKDLKIEWEKNQATVDAEEQMYNDIFAKLTGRRIT